MTPRTRSATALLRTIAWKGAAVAWKGGAVALLALVAAAGVADERRAITPFLWVVEHGDATLYLYGSIHAAPDEALPPPRFVVDAFDRSDLLVTEILLDEEALAAAVFAIAQRVLLPARTTLDQLIGESNAAIIEGFAAEHGLPAEAVRVMQPWAVELLFAEAAVASADFSTANGLDQWFHDRAVAAAVARDALETFEDQIDALAGAPLDEQAASLIQTLDAARTGELEALYAAWRSGDTEALAAVMMHAIGESPESRATYDRLFTDRNRAWIPLLIDYLDAGGTTFVVVGAGHFAGPHNVIDLLEEAGVVVTRVRDGSGR